MAPLPDTLLTLVRRSLQTLSALDTSHGVEARKLPVKHTKSPPFGVGSRNPNKLPNGFILGIIAAIGGSLVLVAIWFFFRAKNGGFKFQEGDWDDYKSTVLRRKGPDGRTLTNATKSTKLGGGSIVHGQSWSSSEKYTTNKNKKNKKDRKQKGNSWDEKSAFTGSTDTTSESRSSYYEEAPGAGMRGGGGSGYLSGRPQHQNGRDADLTEYRHEKVARVGGLNRQHDGEHHDYSNTGSEVSTRPLVKNGKHESNKDRKKREKAERAALDKIRKEKAKRDKAAAKAAAEAKKRAAKESKARAQAPAKPDVPATGSTEARDFAQAPITPKRAQPSAAYSFTAGDDETTHTSPTQDGSYYYPAYRPVAGQSPHSANHTPQSRYRENRPSEPRGAGSGNSNARSQPSPSAGSGSPYKPRSRPPSDIPPSFPGSWGNSSDVGTKVYSHHIPGLRKGTSEIDPHESVSQVGARRAAAQSGGYRRGGSSAVGGARRRDSLSDSD